MLARREQRDCQDDLSVESTNEKLQALMHKHSAMLSKSAQDRIALEASQAKIDELSRLSQQVAAAMAEELSAKDLSASEWRAAVDAFSRLHTAAATLNVQRVGIMD